MEVVFIVLSGDATKTYMILRWKGEMGNYVIMHTIVEGKIKIQGITTL